MFQHETLIVSFLRAFILITRVWYQYIFSNASEIMTYFAPCVCFANQLWAVNEMTISNISSNGSGSASLHEGKQLHACPQHLKQHTHKHMSIAWKGGVRKQRQTA